MVTVIAIEPTEMSAASNLVPPCAVALSKPVHNPKAKIAAAGTMTTDLPMTHARTSPGFKGL